MSNIPIGKKQQLTSYRKAAIASWRHPRDPSTYSWLELPVEQANSFLKDYTSSTSLTLTHYVAKVVAYCLEKYSHLNTLLRVGNLFERNQTDVFITTLLRTSKGKDLSGFVIRDAPHKSITEVAKLCEVGAQSLRDGTDKEMKRVQEILESVPSWILTPLLGFQEFLQYTLNLSLNQFGIPKDKFGSVMISNIGALGVKNALIPLSPYARCPMIIGIGKPHEAAVVENGAVVVRNCVTLSFTLDHRYADGVHGAQLLQRFQKIFLEPYKHLKVFDVPA